jgi:cytochrome P450
MLISSITSVFGVFTTLLLLFSARFIYNLSKNVLITRKVGVPVVFTPVDQTSIFWIMLSAPYRLLLKSLLPARIYNRVCLAIIGWEFHEKKRPFDQFTSENRTFILLGLSHFELWTADPQAVQDIILRTQDFLVPDSIGYALGKFGPNVLTSNGEQWARHRKVVASVVTERISKTAFEASWSHANKVLGEILVISPDNSGSTDTPLIFDMLTRITLEVLISAGLGDKVPWKLEDEKTADHGYTMTYPESLSLVTDNVLGVGLIPTKILNGWPKFLPGYRLMTTAGRALGEVQRRNQSILHQERKRMKEGGTAQSNKADLMSNMVRATSSSGESSLSDAEMIGNLFIFTAAGFKTTAGALIYAMVLLARFPLWQDWLIEEVDGLTSIDGTEDLEYAIIFPKCVRIMAFMYEIMRLYGASSRLFKEVKAPQLLQTSTGKIQVPANTRVFVDTVMIHRLPSWRDLNNQSDPEGLVPDPNTMDEEVFRPSRWINKPGSASIHLRPAKGTFLAWSGGQRICPGQKMAQVEFTAVILRLLRRHRVEVTPLEGEGQHDIKERLDARLQDSDTTSGVLLMNGVCNPKENEGLYMRVSQRR